MAVVAILQELFPYCQTLAATLDNIGLNAARTADCTENSTFKNLLETVLVACEEEQLSFNVDNACLENCSSQKELVNRIISIECTKKPLTVLATGYKEVQLPVFSQSKTISVSNSVKLASRFPNTIVTLVKGPFWEWLFSITGCQSMYFLLHKCFLFHPLGRGCYVQISGTPVYHLMGNSASMKTSSPSRPLYRGNLWKDTKMKRSHPPSLTSETEPHKKKSCSEQLEEQPHQSSQPVKLVRASDTTEVYHRKRKQNFPPFSMNKRRKLDSSSIPIKCKEGKNLKNVEFTRTKKKLSIRVLKRTDRKKVHSLISCKRSQVLIKRKRMFYSHNLSEKFPKKNLLESTPLSTSGVRKLVKCVFDPRQLRPSRADDSGVQTAESGKESKFRLPPRLRAAVPLFKKLLSRHKRCRYSYILNNTCPLPENFSPSKSPPGDSFTEQHTEHLGYHTFHSLVPCYTPKQKVIDFLHAVLRAVVPKEILGSHDNRKTFYSHITDFVNLRHHESYSLKEAMEGLKLSHCWWLMSRGTFGNCTQMSQTHPPQQAHPFDQTYPSRPTHISNVENLKLTQMLECLVLWILNTIVVPVIQSFFYVTESSTHKNHVFFYRKPVWKRICELAISDLKKYMTKPLSKNEVQLLLSSEKTFGVPVMRLLPKSSGVRPIINMARRRRDPLENVSGKPARPVNQELQDLFSVLNYEKSCREKLIRSSVLGLNDIHLKWKQFVKQRENSTNPLFFVSVDISGCFDSIPQDKLMSLMERIIHREEYVLRRYCKLHMDGNRIRRKFEKSTTTTVECGLFSDFAAGLMRTSNLHDVIFVDMVHYPLVNRRTLITDLHKHVYCNIFKFHGQYYQQTQGISQGSVLSSLLCSFFYGDMERKFLPRVPPGTGILIRLIDDFLLVVEDGSMATQFLNILSKGISEYNCSVNSNKTIKNFEVLSDGSAQLTDLETMWFPWCGLLINTHTLEVASDYTRLYSQDISDTLTVTKNHQPFFSLQRKLRKYVSMRAHPIYIDTEVNSHQCILKHCFTTMMTVAMKFHSSVKAFKMGTRIHLYSLQLYGIIVGLTRHFYYTARRRLDNSTGSKEFVPFNLFAILCLEAFRVVLQRKQSRHFQIMPKLKLELKHGFQLLSGSMKDEMRRTVAACSSDVLRIKY